MQFGVTQADCARAESVMANRANPVTANIRRRRCIAEAPSVHSYPGSEGESAAHGTLPRDRRRPSPRWRRPLRFVGLLVPNEVVDRIRSAQGARVQKRRAE